MEVSDRDRDKLRGTLELQPTASVSLQTTVDYNRDSYPDSQYGLQKAASWVLGLDGAFAPTEKLTLDAYYTYEDMESQLQSLVIGRGLSNTPLEPHVPCAPYPVTAGKLPEDYYTDPCREWSQSQMDRVHTLGIGSRAKGLMGGKLDLRASLTYTHAVTPIHFTGGSYYSNGLATKNNVVVPAQSLPDVPSELFDVQLNAAFKVYKSSEVRLGYLFRNLATSDWQYDAYTNSPLGVLALQAYIGNNLTSPDYSVHVVTLAFAYRFQ